MMIHIFYAIQFLSLLTYVTGEPCHERKVTQLIGGINGSSHGTISTPNFPQPFPTPLKQSWVIDASNYPDGTLINVYMTQMYLGSGLEVFQRPTIKFCDHNDVQDQSVISPGRQECKYVTHQFPNKEIYDLGRISTTCPYLEIQVTVPTLWGYHFRTSDPSLFHVYGFNVTYEIVSEERGLMNDSCSLRKCSNLGHCYLSDNWQDFFCDCAKGHPGRYCQNSPYCDPENNVTFCSNGGTCRILGSGAGYCECPSGYTGARCEKRVSIPIELLGERGAKNMTESQPVNGITRTSTTCTSEISKSPCSCRPTTRSGQIVNDNWRKYEAVISITSNYTTDQLSMMSHDFQHNISVWFKSKGLSELKTVAVTFQTHRKDMKPSELRIHFHGPLGKRNEVRFVLEEWRSHEANDLNTKISFMKKPLVLYEIPRMQHKSVSVEKNKKFRIFGKTLIISCTAATGPSKFFSERDIRFRWFKDNLPINVSLATRHMTMGKTHLNDNELTSVLMIDVVSSFDGGTYYCEVTDMEFGDQQCGQQEVEVILPPKIEVEPMSLTLEKQKIEKGIVITCKDGSNVGIDPHKKMIEFIWVRSGSVGSHVNPDAVVLEDIFPQGKSLRILRIDHSESFTCQGFSKEGHMSSKTVQVRVLDSKNSPSCKRQWEQLAKSDDKLLWEWTAPNTSAMIPCPKAFYGYAQRPCIATNNGKVEWGKTDFSQCISETLMQINHTLQNAKRGFGFWQESNVVRLMDVVEKYMNDSSPLYRGEGEQIISLLEDIVEYAFARGKPKVNDFSTVFFRTVVKFLKMQNSCAHEKSVLTLCQIIVDVAVRSTMQEMTPTDVISKEPRIYSSDVFLLQKLAISAEANYEEESIIFPHQDAWRNGSLVWLKEKLTVSIESLDTEGLQRNPNSPMIFYLVIAAYKNVSLLLSSNDAIQPVTNNNLHIKLISPVVQISISEVYYSIPQDSHIKIHFNMSQEHRLLVNQPQKISSSFTANSTLKGTYFSCGALDNTKVSTQTDDEGLRWNLDACTMEMYENYAECQCRNSGLFGLLKVSNVEDKDDVETSQSYTSRIINNFRWLFVWLL
ncbi:unnamed protein product [Orchesella dallaii]|uniref:Uncharacterized protein n=1 Tax=Orchesella dallaii TaxID=48710 RepID=A0ABP1QJD4_9HEXA